MRLIVSSLVAAGAVPALLVLTSFITWTNMFVALGWKHIVRATLMALAVFWLTLWLVMWVA